MKFYKLASHFSPILCHWGTGNFFCIIINPCGYSMQTKFHVPRSHSFWEKCDDNLQKFKVAQFVVISNLEILQVIIAFFSDTVRPKNLKFFLYINPYGCSMQTKFHVPRLHSFWENSDDILQNFKAAKLS